MGGGRNPCRSVLVWRLSSEGRILPKIARKEDGCPAEICPFELRELFSMIGTMGHLIFFKDGNVVVTERIDMSKGITAHIKDDQDGVEINKDILDKGKKQCKVYQIE